MTYPFFTAESLMTAGPGFATFGVGHLVALALCAVGSVSLVRIYSSLSEEPGTSNARRRMLRVLAGLMVGMRLSHDACCLVQGSFSPGWWPLHLCNLCEVLCLAYALRPRETLGEVIFGTALPSGALALLMPGWSYCPLFTWASVCGFAEHALMVAFAFMLMCSGEVQPHVRRAWAPLAVQFCYGAASIPLNRVLSTNFGFTHWPLAGTPLAVFAQLMGTPGYLLPYAGTLVVIVESLFVLAEWGNR